MDTYVKNVLSSWNLSGLINIFNEEEVNEEAFQCLTIEMIKELIPKVGKRAIFMKNYKKFIETHPDPNEETEKPKNEQFEIEKTEHNNMKRKLSVNEREKTEIEIKDMSEEESRQSSRSDCSYKTIPSNDLLPRMNALPEISEVHSNVTQFPSEENNDEDYYDNKPLIKKIKTENEYDERFLDILDSGSPNEMEAEDDQTDDNDYDGDESKFAHFLEGSTYSEASTSFGLAAYSPPPLVPLSSHHQQRVFEDFQVEDKDKAVLKLKAILDDSLITRDFLNLDKLFPSQRSILTTTIVQYLMHQSEDKRISLQQFKYYAYAIKCLYPDESIEVYYRIQIRKSGQNYTAGKLYDKYQNLRKKMGFKRVSHAKKYVEDDTPIFQEKDLKLINLLKHVETPKNAKCLWLQTIKYRQYMLRIMRIEDYFASFEFLKHEDGWILFREEFDKLFPDFSRTFTVNWPNFADKIVKHFIKTKAFSMSEITFEGFEKNFHTSAFFMLPFFFKHSKNLPKGSDWVPTKMELLKEFILFTQDSSRLTTIVQEREDKLKALNIPVHPVIAAVGRSISLIHYVAIVVNGNFYKIKSLIEAVEICIKIFVVLNIKYRPECGFVWLFLQKFVMGLETPTNNCTSIIYNLFAELN